MEEKPPKAHNVLSNVRREVFVDALPYRIYIHICMYIYIYVNDIQKGETQGSAGNAA